MAKLTSNTIRELFGAVVKVTNGAMMNKITQRFSNSSKELTVTELFDLWEDYNTPNDSDEIVKMLKDKGVSEKQLEKAFELVGLKPKEGEDDDMTDFSNAIKKAGLTEPTLQYLNSLTESVVLREKAMSNKAIRDVFAQIIDKLETADREDEMESVEPDLGRKRIL